MKEGWLRWLLARTRVVLGKNGYWVLMDLTLPRCWVIFVRMELGEGSLPITPHCLCLDSRVSIAVRERFPVRLRSSQGCVMSRWLFNMHIDGVVEKVNYNMFCSGLNLVRLKKGKWQYRQFLFEDDTVLVADTERKLCRLVSTVGVQREETAARILGWSKLMRYIEEWRCEGGISFSQNGESLEEA